MNKKIKTIIKGQYIPEEDKEDLELDAAFRRAVEKNIKKAFDAGNPVARYDEKRKKAYLEYPNGKIEYVYFEKINHK